MTFFARKLAFCSLVYQQEECSNVSVVLKLFFSKGKQYYKMKKGNLH